MADSIRQRFVDAITDRLTAYTWTAFDGNTPGVFSGRSMFDPDVNPLPVITVLAGLEGSEQTVYGRDKTTMQVDAHCLISIDDAVNTTTLAEPIFAELKKALFSGPVILGTSSRFPLFYTGGGVVDYPEKIKAIELQIIVSFITTYETKTGDPYTLL